MTISVAQEPVAQEAIAQDKQKNPGILNKLALIIGKVPTPVQGVLSVILAAVGVWIGIWWLSKSAFVQNDGMKLDFIMAAAMLCGILAKEIWDNINDTGTVGLRFARLVAAIIVAPIVYSSVKDKLDAVAGVSLNSFAVAFQQGFFWQAVFRTISYGTQKAMERQQDSSGGTRLDRQMASVPPAPDAAQRSVPPAAQPDQH